MLRYLSVLAGAVIIFATAGAQAAETKDIRFTFRNADPVVFSHDIHLQKYKNCKVCHDAIYNLGNRKRFTMAEMERSKSCGGCHSGVKAFSVATEKDCVRCHKGKPRDITYRLKGLGEATFSHTTHIARTGGACKGCHNGKVITGREKGVTMAEMEKGKTCGACHNGSRVFTVAGNCNRCHQGMKPKDIVFKLKDTIPATFSHTVHTAAYACKDCHTGIFPYKTVVGKYTMDDMAKGKSCGSCHNGKDAFSSSGDCATCHKGMTPKDVVFKIKGFTPATFSHAVHTAAYACKECHTGRFPYKNEVGKYTMADMAKGKSCGSCHDGKDVFSANGDCVKCHIGLKPGTLSYMVPKPAGEASFSHEFHLQAYKCADCHTKIFPYRVGATKATMADMENGKSCGTCHGKGKDAFGVDECIKCHKM